MHVASLGSHLVSRPVIISAGDFKSEDNVQTSVKENQLKKAFKRKYDTPLKINMEHNHGGLEDHFPF